MAAVRSTINYAARDCPRAADGRIEAFGFSRERMGAIIERVEVSIDDARGGGCSLDREGFALLGHASAVRDFEDAEQVQRLYPGELEQLLKDATGASRVAVFSSAILRFGERSPKSGGPNSAPARLAHSDYSEAAALRFADADPQRRFAVFNLWRALSPPPQDIPLAVCDARSVPQADRIVADQVVNIAGQTDLRVETTWFFPNQAHRWHYFSDMTRDEVLVWCAYDSDPARPQFVPHSAFDNPACPAEAPPRVSIEARAAAYF